jgi:hypothetical protein
MDEEKRRRLEAAGWRVGDAFEFLGGTSEAGEITDGQKAELDRRLEDLERDSEAGDPWDVVRSRIEDRLTADFAREAARRTIDRSEW